MKINKTVTETVTLKAEDLTALLKEHFKKKGFNVDTVNYHIGSKQEYGDYGPHYFFESVTVSQEKTETTEL